jgi:hypothetical protein
MRKFVLNAQEARNMRERDFIEALQQTLCRSRLCHMHGAVITDAAYHGSRRYGTCVYIRDAQGTRVATWSAPPHPRTDTHTCICKCTGHQSMLMMHHVED